MQLGVKPPAAWGASAKVNEVKETPQYTLRANLLKNEPRSLYSNPNNKEQGQDVTAQVRKLLRTVPGLEKFPNRVAVRCQQDERPGLPKIDKKMLAPKNMKLNELLVVVRKYATSTMGAVDWNKIRFFSRGLPLDPMADMDKLFKENRDEDGLLHLELCLAEKADSCNSVDEEQDGASAMQSAAGEKVGKLEKLAAAQEEEAAAAKKKAEEEEEEEEEAKAETTRICMLVQAKREASLQEATMHVQEMHAERAKAEEAARRAAQERARRAEEWAVSSACEAEHLSEVARQATEDLKAKSAACEELEVQVDQSMQALDAAQKQAAKAEKMACAEREARLLLEAEAKKAMARRDATEQTLQETRQRNAALEAKVHELMAEKEGNKVCKELLSEREAEVDKLKEQVMEQVTKQRQMVASVEAAVSEWRKRNASRWLRDRDAERSFNAIEAALTSSGSSGIEAGESPSPEWHEETSMVRQGLSDGPSSSPWEPLLEERTAEALEEAQKATLVAKRRRRN